MVSKREWLEAGLAIATRDGIKALTIERLCAGLGLTKGSFYHHFKGIRGYKSDLLAHIEAKHTGRFIAGAEAAGASGHDKIQHLLDLVLEAHADSRDQETAVRALQERVDAMRVDYLRSLWLELGGSPRDAEPYREDPVPDPGRRAIGRSACPGRRSARCLHASPALRLFRLIGSRHATPARRPRSGGGWTCGADTPSRA
ncbi:helix-turn-helix domain-containing protein [Nonomuraea sp. NPDC005501]|uniref:TetR/AcrR family transcriptional regulator n=1 Tax=Nonomuraea sp. NPDC005501 TaxID=3156884 RepID=UPI0033A4AFE1